MFSQLNETLWQYRKHKEIQKCAIKKQIEHILNKKKYVVNTTKNVTNYKNISENKESLWFYGISEVS